ncbi:glycoside hydrolase family 3 C-terminal domain-containing protein [Paenibacillus sp. 22594]|uniref:glycoside hydrolase family 3 protein n=1 Tax=Paenibacillus sp. 22594 TaxID=3453947 RepID=UPI003F836308
MYRAATQFPFQNLDLPLRVRIDDLVMRLTLDEKIELMCQYQADIPRLGLQKYKHGTEGAHGVAWLGEATVFPQNIGLACTWNPGLLQKIGSVIGDEARVYYQRNSSINGLTIWAPTVDLERDPRWGRTEEGYGEDPFLTGRLTTSLVQGLQGDDPFYYKAVATLKHFYANNNELNRGSASISIDPRNKREYYLKAFEPAIRDGRAASIMTAYNGVNGIPCNLNHEVNEIVKGEWNMDGFVVSDAGDVLGTVTDHHYADSYAKAVAGSIKAGIDNITDDQPVSFQALRDALDQGLLAEEDLNHALRNTFRVRFRLGEFDPAERNPYSHVPEEKLCSSEHKALSLEAARESIVLLKNDGLLPLWTILDSVAVIGPLADEAFTDAYSGTPPYRITQLQGISEKIQDRQVLFATGMDQIRIRTATSGKYVCLRDYGNDSAVLAADGNIATEAAVFECSDWGFGSFTLRAMDIHKLVTVSENGRLTATADAVGGWYVKETFRFEALEKDSFTMKSWDDKPVVTDAHGRLIALEGQSEFIIEVVNQGLEEAIQLAKEAETAIVFVGNNPYINGKETVDRPDITLPPAQHELIQAVRAVNPRTVVVIIGSYPFAVHWENEHVPAIVFTSHAGQELGHAVADVLFGEYNPAGRLNMTWYSSMDQLPDLMNYDIIKGKRTYQYFDEEVLYPFGHGLSYTDFKYGELTAGCEVVYENETFLVSILICNTGSWSGDEVVQLYIRADNPRVTRPIKTLIGFERMQLFPGESKTVQFTIKVNDLAFWDVTRERYCVEKGMYTLMAGSSSSKIFSMTTLHVEGEEIPARSLGEWVKAVNYDDYKNIYLDECREGGESIRPVAGSGWIAFHDVDLNEWPVKFMARVTGNIQGGEIVLTLDSPAGDPIAVCPILPTGGIQAWTTVECEVPSRLITDLLTPAETVFSERCKLYLHLKGDVQISSFCLQLL